MAIAANRVQTPYDDDIRLWHWTIADGETPTPVVVAGFPDITVQVLAITGAPTIIFEGTTMPADQQGLPAQVFFPLEDPGGVAISFAAAGGEAVKTAVYLLRPRITAGTTVTATCTVLAHRARR